MGRNFYSHPKVHRTKAARPRWFIRPSAPIIGPDGRIRPRQLKPVYLGFCDEMTAKEAAKARDEYCQTLNRTPAFVQSQIKFGDLLDSYEATYLPTLASSTQAGYRTRIRAHIRPAFGERRLCDIGTLDVQDWINRISGTERTKKVVLATLASVFEVAADWGHTSERNPCTRVKVRSTAQSRDLTVPTPAELALFLAATSEPYTTAFEVGLFCGLRVGEIRGLTRRAIQSPELHVIWQRDRHTDELIPPKRGSRRSVALPDWLAEKLAALCIGKGNEDLLWPDLTYPALWEHFNTRAKAVKIWRPGLSLHALRRCYATYTEGDGLQQAMGHSSSDMTRKYIRPTTAMRLRAVEAMRGAIFSGDCQ